MKINNLVLIIFLIFSESAKAQFDPEVGKPGSKAMYKDSSAFIAWASGCKVMRGYQNIAQPSLGYATVGDSSMAIGPVGAGVVSLGDGGEAILSFSKSIANGPGNDFAVFENSFDDTFLELAFVEVSSDGNSFYRFPATSYSDTLVQAHDTVLAVKINNLAGKYRGMYGTGFDLDEMKNIPGLDINNITHVKIIDVVGSINPAFATRDHEGRTINDPWPTPFPSSGFDLDAVGVIHQSNKSVILNTGNAISIYPNPMSNAGVLNINLNSATKDLILEIYNQRGELINKSPLNSDKNAISIPELNNGIYFLRILGGDVVTTKKVIVL